MCHTEENYSRALFRVKVRNTPIILHVVQTAIMFSRRLDPLAILEYGIYTLEPGSFQFTGKLVCDCSYHSFIRTFVQRSCSVTCKVQYVLATRFRTMICSCKIARLSNYQVSL